MRFIHVLSFCWIAAIACAEAASSPEAPPDQQDPGPGRADAARLAQCALPEPCGAGETLAQYVEQRTPSSRNVSVPGAACLLDALAARTPGRYLHMNDHTAASGGFGARHSLVITPDGSALYVRVPYAGQVYDGEEWVDATPAPAPAAKRCTLAPREYFEACKAGLAGLPPDDSLQEAVPDATWACLFGPEEPYDAYYTTDLPWFTACETESPAPCE